ncbi:PREDICTED: glutamine-rich protein 2-like [Wasmannia auropunctata]|uniref:glutamine-rich protein 2-like n=1 Tax=Wasmannia auropunctata TaxID=64793 RepID=UPI0005EFA339|nr:PREDICTED: glutamine-rich protein 2-like [Wasmannia auropunctata]
MATQMSEAPTAANINVSLQISLPQMLDLALGAPEVGAVNFNILHNFLHILLHQINLQTTKVEFHGEDADRIKRMSTAMKPDAALQLQEYDITDATGEQLQQIPRDGDVLTTADVNTDEKILEVKNMKQEINSEGVPEAQRVVSVVNNSRPTATAFKELEQSVKQLQERYQALEDLPPEVERLKDRIADPAADIVNINKRLDASEQGIDKLTTIVQDVIKGDAGVVTADTSLINARLDELEDKVSKMQQWLINLQAIVDVLTEDTTEPATGIEAAVKEEAEEATVAAAAEPVEVAAVKDEIVPNHEKEENAKEIPKVAANEIRKVTPDKVAARVSLIMNETAIAELRQDVTTLKTDVAHIQQDLQNLNERVAKTEIPTTVIGAPTVKEELVVKEPIKDKEKIAEVTDAANLKQCLEAVKNVEATHGEALQEITQRVVLLETKIRHLLEKVESMQEVDKTDDEEIKNLVAKVQEIEMDMEKIGQAMGKLLDDKEKQETDINALLEQIELLKTVKANKEDLEDALADKADTQTVERKVSYDQFDTACDDLTRGFEEAIDKLTKQESIWQQALDEVQNEISTKMDKVEMTPLKDFVNNKLKSLQEKLKIMIEARREIEAAGTKKLLRDVQCISCDKDVVMKTEEITTFRVEPFPCTTSLKPYLTYKLDQVRKQQKRLPHGRNMIQFEAAMQEETKKMKAKEELAKTKDHLCNRYCGGSHTITTPQQRVMRMGHFFTQWGPETIQLTDGLIRGKDGQMYRSRPMRDKSDVCEPSCWENQISEETGRSCTVAPSQLSQECTSTAHRKSLPSLDEITLETKIETQGNSKNRENRKYRNRRQ